MVLSSFSPLFILWAIRGNDLVPDRWFIGACAFLVIAPNFSLWFRLRIARKREDERELVIGAAEDHRDHVLVYLFAMLLPFYSEDLGTWRLLGSSLAALGFIVFLFWHLNLHYMNLMFAVLGYRVFTIYPPEGESALTGKPGIALITRRGSLSANSHLTAYRLSNTVYLEKAK
ncbi:MAG TPA: hypothetical protein VGS22_29655 [Thermoanaerobaculia bacterium]|jgi:hypothetical protein|nr:hypothetical protein [Thermoanaerobaculia bacterium]